MVTITTTFQPMRDEQGAVRLSVRRLVLDDDGFSVGVNEQGIEVRGDDETHRRLAQKLAGELITFLAEASVTWEQVVLWLAERGLAEGERGEIDDREGKRTTEEHDLENV